MILFTRNSKSKSKLGVGEWAINGKWVHGDLGEGVIMVVVTRVITFVETQLYT